MSSTRTEPDTNQVEERKKCSTCEMTRNCEKVTRTLLSHSPAGYAASAEQSRRGCICVVAYPNEKSQNLCSLEVEKLGSQLHPLGCSGRAVRGV